MARVVKSTSSKKIIFHYSGSFRIYKNNRASQVRPRAMIRAFNRAGYETKIISETHHYFAPLGLLQALTLKRNEYDFCYSETTTYPLNIVEYLFFLTLRAKSIPVYIYIRDAVTKIGTWKPKHYWWQKFRFARDRYFFSSVPNRVLVPSQSFKKLLGLPKAKLLPPASDPKKIRGKFENRTLIYVGGASKRYGTLFLFEVMKKITKKEPGVRLILITRIEELNEIYPKWRELPWLDCYEAEEKELGKYYRKASIALMPLEPAPYSNAAVPVKLFEYISYGLPIVSTSLTETAKFINKNNAGVVAKNKGGFVGACLKLIRNKQRYENYRANTLMAAQKNTWDQRAEKIIRMAHE